MSAICLLAVLLAIANRAAWAEFRFTVTADPQAGIAGFTDVLGAVNGLVGGPGEFHITAGDAIFFSGNIEDTRAVVDSQFGSDYPWYLLTGNHETYDMDWVRDEYNNGNHLRTPLKDRTNQDGPATARESVFTWDRGNAHFVFLNVYWDGTDDTGAGGDIVPALYDWLAADLAANDRPATFVFGHEPAFPYERHVGDSLDQHPENRDAFWQLLEQHDVTAYFCGHTHYYSTHRGDKNHVGDVWQINPAAAGYGGSAGPRMFLDVTVDADQVSVAAFENDGGWGLRETLVIDLPVVAPASVADRRLFYGNSALDGNGLAAAIATNKMPLLPGQQASFASYTSFSRGINGLVIDVAGLHDPDGVSAVDFEFRVGNDDQPSLWATAPAPTSVEVFEDAGADESDRIIVTWADHAIQDQWLQITLKATAATGLESADVFFFGNAVGETGDNATHALVTAADLVAVREHPRGPANRATVATIEDFNRDRLVNADDMLLARNAATSPFTALRLISPPAAVPPTPVPEPSAALLVILGGLTVLVGRRRPGFLTASAY